jgi:hypothetical protein
MPQFWSVSQLVIKPISSHQVILGHIVKERVCTLLENMFLFAVTPISYCGNTECFYWSLWQQKNTKRAIMFIFYIGLQHSKKVHGFAV